MASNDRVAWNSTVTWTARALSQIGDIRALSALEQIARERQASIRTPDMSALGPRFNDPDPIGGAIYGIRKRAGTLPPRPPLPPRLEKRMEEIRAAAQARAAAARATAAAPDAPARPTAPAKVTAPAKAAAPAAPATQAAPSGQTSVPGSSTARLLSRAETEAMMQTALEQASQAYARQAATLESLQREYGNSRVNAPYIEQEKKKYRDNINAFVYQTMRNRNALESVRALFPNVYAEISQSYARTIVR